MSVKVREWVAECDRACCQYYLKTVDDGMVVAHCDHDPPGTGDCDCPYYLIFQCLAAG